MATGRATKASLTRPGTLPLGASRKVGHLALLGAGTRTRQEDSALLAGRHRSVWSALAGPAPLWHKPVGGEGDAGFQDRATLRRAGLWRRRGRTRTACRAGGRGRGGSRP